MASLPVTKMSCQLTLKTYAKVTIYKNNYISAVKEQNQTFIKMKHL